MDWAAAVPWWAALWLVQRTACAPALPGAVGVSAAGTAKCPPRHKDAQLSYISGVQGRQTCIEGTANAVMAKYWKMSEHIAA